MIIRKMRFTIFTAFMLLNATCNVFSALELELTQGIEGAISIAVLPIQNESTLSTTLSDVIRSDLSHSGHFRVKYDEQTKEANADFFWEGHIEKAFFGGTQIHFDLLNASKKEKILSQTFNLKKGYERQLAHHISDLIYEKIIGDKGIFATKLAYVLTERNDKGEVFHHLEISDSDGYRPFEVMRSTQPLMSPTWSPDGKHLAFVSFENRRASVYSLEVQSGKRELITQFPGINGAPAWSPDGQHLALVLSKSGSPKLYTLDLKTKKLTQLTQGFSIDTEPDWAPDNKSLVFTSDRGGQPQIYRYWFDSKKVTRVTFVGSYNARARFSSDSHSLVMLHKRGGMFNIAIQELDTNDVWLLSYTGRAESPSFSPNGKFVLYSSSIGQRRILNLVSTDGKVKLRLPSRYGDVQEPAWSPYLS